MKVFWAKGESPEIKKKNKSDNQTGERAQLWWCYVSRIFKDLKIKCFDVFVFITKTLFQTVKLFSDSGKVSYNNTKETKQNILYNFGALHL